MKCSYPCIKLNSGFDFPIVGLGTWKSKPGEVKQSVIDAIEAGYRHIDCALAYDNETEVGAALKAKMDDGTIKREDVFITSKLWNTFHSKEQVMVGLKLSLERLGLAYLDLYLIHWPMGFKEKSGMFPKDADGKFIPSGVDYLETWQGMEEAAKQGLTKSIGLSNFNSQQISRVMENCTIKPSVLQIECHPYLPQTKMIDFCKQKGIVVTSYSPLGSADRPWAKPEDPSLLEDPKLKALAQKYNKSLAQVLIKYQLQRGLVCIPKSVTKSRIVENFKVFDFELSPEDIATITGFACNGRLVHLNWVTHHPDYPFKIEF